MDGNDAKVKDKKDGNEAKDKNNKKDGKDAKAKAWTWAKDNEDGNDARAKDQKDGKDAKAKAKDKKDGKDAEAKDKDQDQDKQDGNDAEAKAKDKKDGKDAEPRTRTRTFQLADNTFSLTVLTGLFIVRSVTYAQTAYVYNSLRLRFVKQLPSTIWPNRKPKPNLSNQPFEQSDVCEGFGKTIFRSEICLYNFSC